MDPDPKFYRLAPNFSLVVPEIRLISSPSLSFFFGYPFCIMLCKKVCRFGNHVKAFISVKVGERKLTENKIRYTNDLAFNKKDGLGFVRRFDVNTP